MTVAQWAAIGPLLSNHQLCDDKLTAHITLPAVPGANSRRATRVDFLNRLRRLRTALLRMDLPLQQLRQERLLHADPYGTAAWLQTRLTTEKSSQQSHSDD